MNLSRKLFIILALAALPVPATNSRANNNAFPVPETSWSRWIAISGSRAAGVDYSHKDDKGYSCVRFRNRFSYPVHIDCLVTVKKDQQTHTEKVGWLLKRGESGQDLANDC